MDSGYLIDTNILLQIVNPSMPGHLLCKQVLADLYESGNRLYFTLQIASEFWNVSTRPLEKNGHGSDPGQASRNWAAIEQLTTFLPDDRIVYRMWRDLVETNRVRGVQVHNAKLAATMLAYNVPNLLTLNVSDFARFTRIRAIHPSAVRPQVP